MANNTIYPYGTNGELPSSIGLINDLVTGGSDNALTAQQGQILGDYLFGRWQNVDLSSVTVQSYSVGANTTSSNKWLSNGKHFVVPVTPGESIRIRVLTSTTNGAWYAFFTSSYTVPTSSSSPVYYVTGTGRVWQYTSSGESTLTVPATAAYICMCPKDGDGNTSTWSMSRFVDAEIKDDFVESDSDALYVNIYNDVDIDSITVSGYTMKSSGWGMTAGAGKHMVVPVSPSDKIKVRATASSAGGNFRAFLTSSYVVPTADNQTIPYVSGTSRVWQTDSQGWVNLTVPATGAYLCLVVENGDGDTTTWQVQKADEIPVSTAIENYTLKKSDVVNNLYDGGNDVPLSAAQGKALNEKIVGGIPTGLTRYTYYGAAVRASNEHQVATKKVATVTSQKFQGGACFGNYLFMFTEDNTTCWMYNLSSNSLVQTITIASEERGFVSNCHCNTVNFGTEYYNANDPFPLVYVSTGYNDGTDSGALVYRIVATTESDVTTYSLSLVQTLKLPGTGWTEFLVGEDGFCYLCYTSARKIYKMAMPKLSQGDMTFNLSNALSTYQFTAQPSWYNGSRNQNRIYKNGKIYMVSGVPGSSETTLFIVLDLATERREVEIDLSTLGFTAEPETVFIWRNQFCIAFRDTTGIYAIYFD